MRMFHFAVDILLPVGSNNYLFLIIGCVSITAGAPPKTVYKSGLSTTTLSKGKLSSGSPLPSQADQHGAPATPIGSVNVVKGRASIPDCVPAQSTNKSAGSDKEIHSRLSASVNHEKSKYNRDTEAKPADLRSLMISLLQEHQSKGMSLKVRW